jgi:hypothetical protein
MNQQAGIAARSDVAADAVPKSGRPALRAQ